MTIDAVSSKPYVPSAPSGPSAKPSAAAASGAPTNTFSDEVTLSPQAKSIMASGTPPLTLAGGGRAMFDFDRAMMEKMNAYHGQVRDHMRQLGAFTRGTFGLGKVEDGGGLMLSGEISNVIKKAMANAGMPEPEKPADIKAWEDARNADAADEPTPKPGAGTQGTSMVTLYLPEDKGGGSVELWFDNKGLDKLASLSADTLKDNLLDLMKGGAQADAANTAIKNGVFGKFMDENAEHHAEYKTPKARLAYVDPEAPAGSSPLFMIQSQSQPDYVTGHADELVSSVLNLLKAAKG